MKARRWVGLLSAVALLGSGCATAATASPVPSAEASVAVATSTSSQAPATAGTQKPGVTLTVWTLQSDPPILQQMYTEFEHASGNKITVVKLPDDGFETNFMTKWSAGERPDMLEWHGGEGGIAQLDPTTNLQDLSNMAFVARSGGNSKAYTSVGSTVYGLLMGDPAEFGIYYRKDIFERLGLTPPSTSNDILGLCAQIKAKDPSITPISEGAGSGWPPYVMTFAYMGGQMLHGWADKLRARTARLDDADSPLLKSLRFYVQAKAAGCFNKDYLSAKYEDTYKALATGTAAMVSQHSGILIDMRAAYGDQVIQDKIGFAAWSGDGPVVSADPNPSGTFYLAKTGNPAREAAARDFIDFMSGPAYTEYVNATKQYPTLDGVPVPTDVPPALKQAHEAMKVNGYLGTWGGVNLPGLDFSPIDAVVAGTMTPEDAVKKIQLGVNQGAKAAGLPTWP